MNHETREQNNVFHVTCFMFHVSCYNILMKLLITGGHTTPALACLDEMVNDNLADVIFVGRKYNTDREKTLTFEYSEVTARNVLFIHLLAGRMTRMFSLKNLVSMALIPIGFLHAFLIVTRYKPDRVLSFGGYIALPVCAIAYLLRIPVYTHEQTIQPGMTNRFIAAFAKKVFVSFSETTPYFPEGKVVITGNPVRKVVHKVINKPFIIDKNHKVIYITGGSLGSHSINGHVKNIIPSLLKKYTVIHQTGNVKEYHDYEDLIRLRSSLPSSLQERYVLRLHITGSEIGFVYSTADLVISRSGANTFSELIALQKPALLIPLPWSANGEQSRQAQILKEHNVAEVFNQYDRSSQLLALVQKMMNNIDQYRQNYNKLSSYIYPDAAKKIISEVTQNR